MTISNKNAEIKFYQTNLKKSGGQKMKKTNAKTTANKKNKVNYITLLIMILGVTLLMNVNVAYAAAGGYSGLDKLFEMFAGIIQKVAGGIGLLGAVFFGLGIYQDNPDGKVRGIKMMAAGAFLFAVATGYTVFLT